MLVIKINCVKLGITKKLQVHETLRVEQVIQQIQEKTPGTKPKTNENYGLFLPNDKNKKKSQWLLNSRTLEFYDIESEMELLYQDKNRHLKVKMLDGSIKTVLVDDSKSVGHALDIICDKLALTNVEEYALFIEEEKDTSFDLEDEPDILNTSKGGAKRFSRMVLDMVEEQQNKRVATLKRKAHTDDDTNWLKNSHSLQEAGVSDESLVVIRRRYTYEPSINITNPIEIQLSYIQSRESILDGSHPCSSEEAAKLAAFQNQIQHGDYEESKYRTVIEPKECFPKDYVKNKEAIRRCKEEHKMLKGLDDLNGKYKYIQLCQNLPTYGVTLFIVKEKMKGKNKLMPRLLGVNKDAVMKLDEKTKKILKMWPLTTLRRWAASPNSFTLDFGAYSEGMYTVQTIEGQQISQLIGGYIDIILKKRNKVTRTAPPDDESGVIGEYTVGAQQKQIIQNQKFSDNEQMIPKYGRIGNISGTLSPAQQALVTDLDNSGKAVIVLMEELDDEHPVYEELESEPPAPDDYGLDFDIESALASIANASASVITSSEDWEEEKNLTSTRSAINTILSNLKDLSQHARFMAGKVGKDEGDGKDLLDAARKLADAFKDLTFTLTPSNDKTQEDVYAAINKLNDASNDLGATYNKKDMKSTSEILIMLTKGVEKATADLSSKTKELADSLDAASANKLSEACKKAEIKAQHLSMCTKILIPYIADEKSKLQLANTMKLVGKDVNSLAGLCVVASDDDNIRNQITNAAKTVSSALNNLLQEINTQKPNISNGHVANGNVPNGETKEPVSEENVYEIILSANDLLLEALNDPDEVVRQATRLGKATSQIVHGMNEQAYAMAEGIEKNKLYSAAKLLTDATTALLTAAKVMKENPESKEAKGKLKLAALNLRFTTNMATNHALKKALILKLEHAAKKSVAAATQLVSAGKSATPFNPNPVSQQKFNEARQILIMHSAKDLIHAVKESEKKPGNQTAQSNLIRSATDFIPVAARMVESSKSIEQAVTNKNAGLQLSKARVDADKSLTDLQHAITKTQESQEDVDEALTAMKKLQNDLDQASLAAISDLLKPKTADKIKTLEEKMVATFKQLKDELLDVTENGKGVPEEIGPSVHKMAKVVKNVADLAIGFAANLSAASEKQTESLDMARTIVESVVELFNACKDAGGNAHAVELHQVVDECSDNVMEAMKDFLKFVSDTVGDIDSIKYLVSSIDNAMQALMNQKEVAIPEKSFVEYQSNMIKTLKAIARDAHDMVGKAQTKPRELSSVSEDVYSKYNALVGDAKHAVLLLTPEGGEELQAHVSALGEACKQLIESAGQFQVSSDDIYAKQSLSENAKDVSVKVALVMSDLQKGSVGTQECINAVSYLSGLIGDIDTTVMFAHAGTLDPEDDRKFIAHKDIILSDSQDLVKNTKALVGSAQKSQEQLAGSVTEVLSSATKLLDSVKVGASSLGVEDKNGQILLLNAVKDVASALSDLINATKMASGKPADHPAAESLTSSAKHMVGCLTLLLQTVRSVEDEKERGTRAIESSIDAIKQASVNLQPDITECERTISPEDLIRATKGVTVATAKIVSAGKSLKQADIIDSVNVGRQQCLELLDVAQASVCTTPSENVKVAVITSVRETAQAYCQVLSHLLVVMKNPVTEEQLKFAELSKNVASSVANVVKISSSLKGDDLVNPEDPNVIAENELLGAASQIEAAARKLADLQPRINPKEVDESLNFEEQILEAAKSITAAAGVLVKAATAAQRELIAQGVVFSNESDSYADTQWSQGLISAARLVAAATGSLCEAANAAVLGNASQEKLVASAQAVSASTAQLLLACRVKADANSEAQQRLQSAGSKVRTASDKLVKAAQETIVGKDEVDGIHRKKVRGQILGGLVDQIEAKEAVLRKERELDEARRKLEQIQMARYQHRDVTSPVWEDQTFF